MITERQGSRTPVFPYFMFLLLLAVLFPQALFAKAPGTPPASKHFLFHIKTSLEEDDAQICVAPNLAWAALDAGHRVTLLFDGSAVTSVTKKWRFFKSPSTDMDQADLPQREKRALSEQFNTQLEDIPENYGAYLEFLKAKGADLFINKTMTILYKIEADKIDPNLTPVTLDQMIQMIEGADVYIVY